jgi:ABC-type transport system substrate-binding protein
MNLLKKIILFFITVVFITITACKKYPDGSIFSISSKTGRLCQKWEIVYFSINGYDSTEYVKNAPFYGSFEFGKPQAHNPGDFAYEAKNEIYSGAGNWQFSSDKKTVTIYSIYNPMYQDRIGPYRAKLVVWNILRLKEKELWLETTYGKDCFVKFKCF